MPRSNRPAEMKTSTLCLLRLVASVVWVVVVSIADVTARDGPPVRRVVELADAPPIELLWIEPGAYLRGSPSSEPDRDPDEGPLHRVVLTHGFYLATHEVTQAQWRSVMGENPALFQQGKDAPRRPVESVSWLSCADFLRCLNARSPGHFRLPTEAEWEYACRAGTSTRYPWGDAPEPWQTHPHAWANSRSFAMPHAVGGKPSNPFGLHDMNGNVWEWCSDWYAPYSEGEQVDPQGPAGGDAKVFRGGSWFDFPRSLRSANRHKHGTDRGYAAIGLRVAWDPDAPRPTGLRVFELPGGVPLEMVEVPAGSFTMGSSDLESGRQPDEGPPHQVTVSKPFHVGKFEVTQAQWRAVLGESPSMFRRQPQATSLPVDSVSWDDAQRLIAKLNETSTGQFRLPTEAEWEYACRAGSAQRLPWGPELNNGELRTHGWFNPESEGRSHPVGRKQASFWGLHDMHGSVWEWCADWSGDYTAARQIDPLGPAIGDRKIVRGGSWFNEPEALRPANRHAHPRDYHGPNLGLRLVWTPEKPVGQSGRP